MGKVPYQKENVITISGLVEGIETVMNKQTLEPGLHLKLNYSNETYTVHVCPQWYADKKNIRFTPGDSLIITGSSFVLNNEKNLYAATIMDKSQNIFKFRDRDTGQTLWAGKEQNNSQAQNNPALQEETKSKKQKGDGTLQRTGGSNQKKGRID